MCIIFLAQINSSRLQWHTAYLEKPNNTYQNTRKIGFRKNATLHPIRSRGLGIICRKTFVRIPTFTVWIVRGKSNQAGERLCKDVLQFPPANGVHTVWLFEERFLYARWVVKCFHVNSRGTEKTKIHSERENNGTNSRGGPIDYSARDSKGFRRAKNNIWGDLELAPDRLL